MILNINYINYINNLLIIRNIKPIFSNINIIFLYIYETHKL